MSGRNQHTANVPRCKSLRGFESLRLRNGPPKHEDVSAVRRCEKAEGFAPRGHFHFHSRCRSLKIRSTEPRRSPHPAPVLCRRQKTGAGEDPACRQAGAASGVSVSGRHAQDSLSILRTQVKQKANEWTESVRFDGASYFGVREDEQNSRESDRIPPSPRVRNSARVRAHVSFAETSE